MLSRNQTHKQTKTSVSPRHEAPTLDLFYAVPSLPQFLPLTPLSFGTLFGMLVSG